MGERHSYSSKNCATSITHVQLSDLDIKLGLIEIHWNLTVLVPHHTISIKLLIRLLLQLADNS